MKRRLALSYEQLAEECRAGDARQVLLVGGHLQSAAGIYRDIGDGKKVRELLPRIKAAHKEESGHYGQIKASIDCTELITFGQGLVRGKVAMAALLSLTHGLGWESWAKTEANNIEMRKEAPLFALVPRVYMTPEGNVAHKVGSLLSKDPKEQAAAHRALVMEDYCKTLELRGAIVLEFARREMIATIPDIDFAAWALLLTSPITPKERATLIWRGVISGIFGDAVVATHILVPQIEALVRERMEKAGRVVTSLKGNIQEEKSLSNLLEDEKAFEILGTDLTWELRAILTDRAGMNLRNRLAHGLLSSQVFHTGISNNLWWMILKLVSLSSWGVVPDSEDDELTPHENADSEATPDGPLA
jgi:hypothetical protein